MRGSAEFPRGFHLSGKVEPYQTYCSVLGDTPKAVVWSFPRTKHQIPTAELGLSVRSTAETSSWLLRRRPRVVRTFARKP